ncbi:head-tail adaptor protein [Roseibium sp.]|uniref:head-tail adaptor protein n=1 Tax=Roseibium sp. TaxID=1936156 RepID=UPI003A9830D9
MSAGRYRTPVTLEQPVVTHGADGTASLVYLSAGADFAAIRPSRLREELRGERLEGVVTHEIRLRHRDDITGGWRMSAGLRRYRLLSVAQGDDRGTELFCLAEEEGT